MTDLLFSAYRRRTTSYAVATGIVFATLFGGTALAQAEKEPASARDMRDQIPDLHGPKPSNVPENLRNPEAADVTIIGHVLEPEAIEPTPERVDGLSLPDGFSIDVFADDLGNPRMIEAADDGTVYVTRRKTGDVLMLKDEDGDGEADAQQVVAKKKGMHGIEIQDDTVWLMTVNEVYRTSIADDGTFGQLELIADDFPSGGQHPNRTLEMGPDGMLYVSVGSTCNACGETEKLNATMVRMQPDGSQREIFATGLRNTIGFAFEPQSGELYGLDHGIDWLGDDEQPEEFNHLQQGHKYGWPYIYADSQINPQDEPPNTSPQQWAQESTEPVLMWTPHAAPMQMAFYQGDAFPEQYHGDAFAAMRGSWNRKPPSGYEIVRIRFENGQPQAIERFVTGFVMYEDNGWKQMGRLAGLAVAEDGALLVSDDANGRIYRISYDGGDGAS